LGDTAGGRVIGPLQDDGIDGSSDKINALIRTSGESLVKAGGNITDGDPLQDDGNGQAILASSADEVFGRARETAVSGDYFTANIDSEGIKA